MIYCDTSLLVSALSGEPAAPAVHRWLLQYSEGELCTSTWTVTEFSSAVAIKYRRADITAEDKVSILARWAAAQNENLVMLPVPQEAFSLAARFCDMSTSSLRGGDALHLAVASLGGHALATLDGRMREGAEAVGVRVVGV